MYDVVGHPLDVIASGPTAADPSPFKEAVDVLGRFGLLGHERMRATAPTRVVSHLLDGGAGSFPEAPKNVEHVRNIILGNNNVALLAARKRAEELGYPVLNLGPFVE